MNRPPPYITRHIYYIRAILFPYVAMYCIPCFLIFKELRNTITSEVLILRLSTADMCLTSQRILIQVRKRLAEVWRRSVKVRRRSAEAKEEGKSPTVALSTGTVQRTIKKLSGIRRPIRMSCGASRTDEASSGDGRIEVFRREISRTMKTRKNELQGNN